MTMWLAIIVLAIGILLVMTGRHARRSQGLTAGRTLALDNKNLYSAKYGLVGRPDRIVEENGVAIPEEWKSSHRVYDSHRAQIVVYFLLMEEETGVRPPHGYIVLGDGQREKVENTPEIREWVLNLAAESRSARRALGREIPVNQPPGKCRSCGVREWCAQRKG